MAKTLKELAGQYYNKQSAIKVLSGLCKDTRLLGDKKYELTIDDFKEKTHRTLFGCIYNLYLHGATNITLGDVESYLSFNGVSAQYNLFFAENNIKNLEWLSMVIEGDLDSNFQYYYDVLRKFSLLRNFLKAGVDIKFIYDVEENDVVLIDMMRKRFEKLTCEEIIELVNNRMFEATSNFFKKEDDFRFSGDDVDELMDYFQQAPLYGTNLESKYLTTLTGGNLGGSYHVETRQTGRGKSRFMLKRLVLMCSPYLWSFEENKYIKNPNNLKGINTGSFIQTELNNYVECEPIILSCIAGINTAKIKKRQSELTEEEIERLEKAKEYSKQMKLMLHRESNYDTDYIKTVVEQDIKRAKEMGKRYVALGLDYINFTPALGSEYVRKVGLAIREDMVLLNLSAFLKDSIANFYGITVFACTQVNGDAVAKEFRNENCIKGCKAIPSKATSAWSVFSPTPKELKLIEPILEKKQANWKKRIKPNIVYTIYKMRDGEYASGETKIFAYQDLGTMELIDLCVTNSEYEELPNVPFVEVTTIEED